jgi:lysophospholipase L1-like esterase
LFVLNRALDYPEVFDQDADLFWRLRPNQTVTSRFFEGRTYRINDDGLRGPAIPAIKSRRRVLLLGNSCTFGWGVARDSTFASMLQQRLGDDYLVINAGIPGYSSLQGRRFLERDLVFLQPDFVVAMFGWNDQWAAASEIADKDQPHRSRWLVAIQNRLARLHTYRLLKKLLLDMTMPPPDDLFDRHAPVYRVSFDDYYANLREICQTADRFNAQCILMTEPQPSNLSYGVEVSGHPAVLRHQQYNATVRALAQAEGLPLVDAARAFDDHDNLYDNVRKDYIHFNARGHALIARLLEAKIRQLDSRRGAIR